MGSQIWEPVALFDALHLSRGVPQTICKLFTIARRTCDIKQIMEQAKQSLQQLQNGCNAKTNEAFAHALFRVMMVGEFGAARKLCQSHPNFSSQSTCMDKISEALHNIDGMITREFNGNEHTTLVFNQI